MHDHDVGTLLERRLAALRWPVDARTREALRDDVWNYVDDRKAAGWPPEHVLIAVKQIAREAGLRPSLMVITVDGKLTSLDELLTEIVGWCIHRYYDGDGQ